MDENHVVRTLIITKVSYKYLYRIYTVLILNLLTKNVLKDCLRPTRLPWPLFEGSTVYLKSKNWSIDNLIFLDIREIYDLLEEYKAEDDTVETLHKVIRLYDRWIKQTIFNCPRSGYGPAPSDWPTDDRGETCSRSNRLATFKCRIQFRFGEIYNSFSPSHGLNFN